MLFNEYIHLLPTAAVTVEKRVQEYLLKNPSATLIRLDQDLMNMPLPDSVRQGMIDAVREISDPFGVKLECPWSGYAGVKRAVCERYNRLGVTVLENEVFMVSGLESGYNALSQLFGPENNVLLPDPGKRRLTLMQQAAGRNVSFLRATPENRFLPAPGADGTDLIFLSSPNVITGVSYTRAELQKWVDFACDNGSLLFFDSSLSEYVSDEDHPRSIYELDGAADCAVELFSFERGYGVKELKIAYLVIPQALSRGTLRLHQLFSTQQPAIATPPSFVMQKAAEHLLSPEAKEATEKIVRRIQRVAATLSRGLAAAGIPHVGEDSSPYIWAQCPDGMTSWKCFDRLLEEAQIVVTPGTLYGYAGENFVRITSFGLPEEAKEATEKLVDVFRPVRFAAPEAKEAEEEAAKVLFSDESVPIPPPADPE